jgi:broad specificity phosphatase PhoE
MHQLPKILVVARHAESVRNVAKAGQVFFPDPEARRGLEGEADHLAGLTDTGREQARALGERLSREFGAFDLVYHSGYRRARETAELAVTAMGSLAPAPTVHEHLFLRERDAGYTFNMTTAEAAAAFPWLQPYWQSVGPLLSRPPGGESLADVAARVQLFFESRERELADRRVLLVTHAGTIRMLRYLLDGWTHDEAVARWRHEPLPNASFVAYDAECGRLRLRVTDASAAG